MGEPRKDAPMWAGMLATVRAAGSTDSRAADQLVRTLIAVARRHDPLTPGVRSADPLEKGAPTYAPGETIPSTVTRLYDLDGDIWERQNPDPSSPQYNAWKMRDFRAEEHDSQADGLWDTPHLLTEYGPLTALP